MATPEARVSVTAQERRADDSEHGPGGLSRRHLLSAAISGSLAVAAGVGGAPAASASRSRTDLVLIHGGSHGGWAWRRVIEELGDRRGRIIAPTMPGVGERAHRLTPGISFQEGIDDIVAAIEAEELENVVLVGHSIGGAYASAAGERVADRLRGFISLDGVVVDPGERVLDMLTPASQAALPMVAAQAGGGYSIPKPNDPRIFGVTNPDDIAWLDRRLTAHPWASWIEVVPVTGVVLGVPKLYIDCSEPGFADVEPSKQRVRARSDEWTVSALATGHDAMVTAPRDVAKLIRRFCDQL